MTGVQITLTDLVVIDQVQDEAIHAMSLDEHAEAINKIKSVVRKVTLSGAIQIGRHLAEVKNMLPHGEWGKWLRDNVDCSERSAQQAMALAAEYGHMDAQAIDGMTYSNAVAMIGLTSSEREQVMASLPGDASTRDVKEAVRQLKEERDKQQTVIDGLQEQLKTLNAEMEAREAERQDESKDKELDRVKRQLERINKQLDDAQEKQQEAEKKQKNAERDAEGARAMHADTEAQLHDAQAEAAVLRERLAIAQEALDKATKADTVYQDSPETLAAIEKLKAQKDTAQAMAMISEAFQRARAELGRMQSGLELLNDVDRATIIAKLLADIRLQCDEMERSFA